MEINRIQPVLMYPFPIFDSYIDPQHLVIAVKTDDEAAEIMGELRAAGLVIFRQMMAGVEYLLMQTSYGTHHWTPPKGHVDPGESDKETALRETQEEAGLTDKDFTLIETFRKELKYEVKGKPKTVVYWLAELNDSNTAVTLSEEHQDFRWLPLAEACALAAFPDMIETLKQCEDFINQRGQ